MLIHIRKHDNDPHRIIHICGTLSIYNNKEVNMYYRQYYNIHNMRRLTSVYFIYIVIILNFIFSNVISNVNSAVIKYCLMVCYCFYKGIILKY